MSRRPEADFQRVAITFLHRALPEGAYIASIDSAQRGHSVQRLLDAQRGILAGQPDIECLVAGFPPLKIELKIKGGQVSPAQEHVMNVWRRNGGGAFVAYSLDELEAGLRAYGIPLRASAGGRWEHHLQIMEARAAKPKRRSKPRAPKATAAAKRLHRKMYGLL